MDQFDPLIGSWHGSGEIPVEPPLAISVETTIERMGTLIVMRSAGEPEELPDSISIISSAASEPQPMAYFDARGVHRRYLTAVEGTTWRIWLAPGEDPHGPQGPGFNQRFIGELSDDGSRIDGRWERGAGDSGDQWEIDFPLTYVRR